MSHWASDYFTSFDSTIEGTGWSYEEPSSDRAPILFTHDDGTELSLVNSTNTGTVAVEYDAPDSVTDAIKDDHTSWNTVSNAIEWLEHTLK